MSRAPRYYFTLGDKTLDELNLVHLIKRVEFIEEVGKFDQVNIHVKDGPELKEAYSLCKHGSVLQLSMGYYNDEVLPMTIVFMKGCKPNFKDRTVVIKYAGYMKAMDVGAKDRVLNNKTIKEIVTEIVASYDPIEVGTIDNGDTVISGVTTQSKESDLKVLEKIAGMFGMRWKMEPSETIGVWKLSLYKLGFGDNADKGAKPIYAYPEKMELSPNVALHLENFSPESNILGVSSTVQIRSNNPNHPIAVDSIIEDLDRYAGGIRGSEIVATVFGSVVRVQFNENVSNEEAAQIIADQLLQEDELAFVVAKNCKLNEGNPNIRVGIVRHVVPRGISLFEDMFVGDYLITKTHHVISTEKGYDTTFDCAMDNLKVPPPPAMGGGGAGGGIPILIHIYADGSMEGWYMSFDVNGTASTGAYITQAEILARQDWLDYIQTQTLVYISSAAGAGSLGIEVGIGLEVDPWQFGPLTTPLLMGALPTSPQHTGYTTVRIGWPPQWNTGVLATSVQETPTYTPEEILEGYYGIPGLGEEEEFVETRPDGMSVLEWAQWQVMRGSVYGEEGGL